MVEEDRGRLLDGVAATAQFTSLVVQLVLVQLLQQVVVAVVMTTRLVMVVAVAVLRRPKKLQLQRLLSNGGSISVTT